MPADYWDLHHHPPHLNPRDYLSPWGQDLPHHIHPPGAIICPPGMGCTPLACTSAPQGLLSAPCLPLLLLLSLLPTLTGGCVQCPPGRRGLAGRFARLCTRYEAGREGRACSKYPWVGQTLRGFALEDQAVEVVTEKIHRVFRLMELGHNLSDLPVFWDWLHEVKLPEFTRDALCPPACRGTAWALNCSTCRRDKVPCWALESCYSGERGGGQVQSQATPPLGHTPQWGCSRLGSDPAPNPFPLPPSCPFPLSDALPTILSPAPFPMIRLWPHPFNPMDMALPTIPGPASFPDEALAPPLLPHGHGSARKPRPHPLCPLPPRLGESPAPTASDRGRLCRLLRTGIGQLHPGVPVPPRAGGSIAPPTLVPPPIKKLQGCDLRACGIVL
ncbi:transmembrane protein 95 isoform X2 [Alligator sinensis]|uniref:Transmembrane protein 95 isoform X2 n=1 Tax=Alligator sinensis TaxID=38654 RepID=A0A3Q0FV17_ALLSI|nr:transmembrane protein 95 isoform X2 [Alligator sinensis]